jgi:soluble cytochrome b562
MRRHFAEEKSMAHILGPGSKKKWETVYEELWKEVMRRSSQGQAEIKISEAMKRLRREDRDLITDYMQNLKNNLPTSASAHERGVSVKEMERLHKKAKAALKKMLTLSSAKRRELDDYAKAFPYMLMLLNDQSRLSDDGRLEIAKEASRIRRVFRRAEKNLASAERRAKRIGKSKN